MRNRYNDIYFIFVKVACGRGLLGRKPGPFLHRREFLFKNLPIKLRRHLKMSLFPVEWPGEIILQHHPTAIFFIPYDF